MHDCFFVRAQQVSSRRSPQQARAFFLRSRHQFSTTSPRRVPPVPLDSPEAKSSLDYCTNLVRKYDSPSYTLSHFIPPHARPAYFAIRAFNIEISRIPDIVSSSMIGQMRHQFWKDTINKTFDGNPPNEPVAVLLAAYINSTGNRLNRAWFHKVNSAREENLLRPGFASLPNLETYAESTYSTLLYLTLSALPLNSLTADHVASHIGKATGIAAVLRGVPLLAFPGPPNSHSNNPPGQGLPMTRDRQRVINLPLDIMSQCGVHEQDIYKNAAKAEGLKDAVFTVATRASDHLITARSLLKDVKSRENPNHEFEHAEDEGHDYTDQQQGDRLPADARRNDVERAFGTIMGPAVSTQLWLDRLQKVDFDIFDNSLRMAEWKLPFVAWWKNRQFTF